MTRLAGTAANGSRAGLRERLASDQPLVGSFVIIPRVEIVELLASAGFDVAVLDCEHGPFGVESLAALIAAAQGAGLAAVVRVADSRPQGIGAALDAGADGVLVPHVQSAAAAGAAVRAGRFPPEGDRGVNPYVRAARYSGEHDYFTEANRRCGCMIMLEGKQGVAEAEAIAAVPGLDGVFLGPFDLSAALGVTGEVEHPLVTEAVETVLSIARRHEVATAIFAATPQAASRWLAHGVHLVALSVDAHMALDGFRATRAAVRIGRPA